MAKIEDVRNNLKLSDSFIDDKIKEKLVFLNIEYNSLPERIIKYLRQIEKIITEKSILKESAMNSLKENQINLTSISEIMKISRTTLYNNEILKEYIKYSIDKFNEGDPYYIIEKLKDSKSELENQVLDMVDRDIEIELIMQNIISLKNELAKKEKECNKLKERREILLYENMKLKAEVRQFNKYRNSELGKNNSIINMDNFIKE